MSFLKTKDAFEEKPCEIKERIDMHDLDDDADYREKVNQISEHETDFEVFVSERN